MLRKIQFNVSPENIYSMSTTVLTPQQRTLSDRSVIQGGKHSDQEDKTYTKQSRTHPGLAISGCCGQSQGKSSAGLGCEQKGKGVTCWAPCTCGTAWLGREEYTGQSWGLDGEGHLQ
jgi:hypothetical protein